MMKIVKEECLSCGSCQAVCPVDAIKTTDDGGYEIDTAVCLECGACAAQCPAGAIVQE